MSLGKRINLTFFLRSFVLPFSLISGGVLLVFFFVILPYASLDVGNAFRSPVVPSSIRNFSGFGEFKFNELKQDSSNSGSSIKALPATFYLSVPKLKIDKAVVETNSTNLDPVNNLGHYRGTALPGEKGNVFLYGHSVLPVFFNPKDYRTIFSTLPRLKDGDEFQIHFGGESYSYEVVSKITLKPEDVNVFDPNPSVSEGESFATLMTCVPPGAKTYRLLVVGRLKL